MNKIRVFTLGLVATGVLVWALPATAHRTATATVVTVTAGKPSEFRFTLSIEDGQARRRHLQGHEQRQPPARLLDQRARRRSCCRHGQSQTLAVTLREGGQVPVSVHRDGARRRRHEGHADGHLGGSIPVALSWTARPTAGRRRPGASDGTGRRTARLRRRRPLRARPVAGRLPPTGSGRAHALVARGGRGDHGELRRRRAVVGLRPASTRGSSGCSRPPPAEAPPRDRRRIAPRPCGTRVASGPSPPLRPAAAKRGARARPERPALLADRLTLGRPLRVGVPRGWRRRRAQPRQGRSEHPRRHRRQRRREGPRPSRQDRRDLLDPHSNLSAADVLGHGTFVASLIAAPNDDGFGLAGYCGACPSPCTRRSRSTTCRSLRESSG